MAERRSLGDALSLSSEKLAFIHGDESSAKAPPIKRGRKPTAKTVDISLPSETTEAQNTTQRRRASEHDFDIPNANELLDEVLVPLTTRLPHRLIQSLRRLCLEQRLRHAKPDNIQEITKVALGEWLLRQAKK
jgi:hypothetical protein